MELLQLFFILLFGHWVGDFAFQSNNVAINKSKSNLTLAFHAAIYTAVLTAAFTIGLLTLGHAMTFVAYTILGFALITFVTHFITDYFTSRMTARYHVEGRRHAFFVTIGFDQLIHQYTLLLTMLWLVGSSL